MRKEYQEYVSPRAEVLEIVAEQVFATSPGYVPGAEEDNYGEF